jgi:type IV secretory pathway TrbL component
MKKKYMFIGFLAMIMIAFLSGPAMSANSVTIVGILNADGQIITDNEQVYEIGENKKGDELFELAGKKVKVTGIVVEEDGTKVITVTSYEVLEE